MDEETKRYRDIFLDVTEAEVGEQATDDSTTTEKSDQTKQATEYACPNCNVVLKRSGWLGIYHHFVECELPDERPPPLSESQWQKVKKKVERSSPTQQSSEEGATEYTCPNCGMLLEGNTWFGMYLHFRDCELPSECPPSLSESQWEKVKQKVERTPERTSPPSSDPTTIADIAGDTNQPPSSYGRTLVLIFAVCLFALGAVGTAPSAAWGASFVIVFCIYLFLWLRHNW